MDPSWSETGDRYLLKLFRDYVFHQVDEAGNPYVDYGHMVLLGNWFETEVQHEEHLKDFLRGKSVSGRGQLKWRESYAHALTLGELSSKAVGRSVAAVSQEILPWQPVMLINVDEAHKEAQLTYDGWTKSFVTGSSQLGGRQEFRVFVSRNLMASSRTTFFMRAWEGFNNAEDRICYNTVVQIFTKFGDVVYALKSPATTVTNLPGGGDANMSITLTPELHSSDTLFRVEPARSRPSTFSTKSVKEHLLTNEPFVLKAFKTGKTVYTTRERESLTCLGGGFFGVFAAHTGGGYKKPIASHWVVQPFDTAGQSEFLEDIQNSINADTRGRFPVQAPGARKAPR
ncbi:PAB-dependent poly(A)-specific ribonuclease subunit 3 [Phlyctochytrium bullatum]|nr:PAB-dependent poly(A)-specific ribonuclease subunit 3 [Phlyctochytrium bullatum]